MPEYTLQEFPKATVAIGEFTHKHYNTVYQLLVKLDENSSGIQDALTTVSKHVPQLAVVLPITNRVFTVSSILRNVLDATEDFYSKVQTTEEKIYSKLLEGKMKALKANLETLQDSNTSDEQKLSEVVNAVSHCHELLPLFAEDSILRQKYYIGGPLFVNFCITLKGIAKIAEELPTYNPSSLQGLKKEYQEVLTWFRNKCIGSRLASCYLKTTTFGFTTRDWERHSKTKSIYYEEKPSIKWEDHKMDLGGKGWLTNCGSDQYYIVDEWDRQSGDVMKFKPLKTPSHSDSYSEQLRADLLMEYRKGVEAAMLDYFNKASPQVSQLRTANYLIYGWLIILMAILTAVLIRQLQDSRW